MNVPILNAVEKLEPRCGSCGSLLPRPGDEPFCGFGFNGQERSSDRAFERASAVAVAERIIACGDCGAANLAVFWRVQDVGRIVTAGGGGRTAIGAPGVVAVGAGGVRAGGGDGQMRSERSIATASGSNVRSFHDFRFVPAPASDAVSGGIYDSPVVAEPVDDPAQS